MKNKRGFTLIELIIVIAVFAIVTAGAGFTLSSFLTKNQLDTNTQQIVQLIRKAQSNSILGLKNDQWGVYFENSSYSFFKGSTYGADTSYDDLYSLPSSLSLSTITISGGSGDEIVFNKINGETSNTATLEITESNSNTTYTITVNALGQVEVN